jgi:hypothetical protein
MPSNLKIFLTILSRGMLRLIPNPFQMDSLEDEGYDVDKVDKLKHRDEKRVLTAETEEEYNQRLLSENIKPQIYTKEDAKRCKTLLIVRENDLSCYLVNSSGDIFLLLMVVGFCKLVLYLIVRFCLKSKQSQVEKDNIDKLV